MQTKALIFLSLLVLTGELQFARLAVIGDRKSVTPTNSGSSAFTHIRLNDEHLIFGFDSGYTISTSKIREAGWTSVSVNRGAWRFAKSDCSEYLLDCDSPSTLIKTRLVNEEKDRLLSVIGPENSTFAATTFLAPPHAGYYETFLTGVQSELRHSDGYEFLIQGSDVTISKDYMPFELDRVLLLGDKQVAFVTKKLYYHIYDTDCLHEDLVKYVTKLKNELTRPTI